MGTMKTIKGSLDFGSFKIQPLNKSDKLLNPQPTSVFSFMEQLVVRYETRADLSHCCVDMSLRNLPDPAPMGIKTNPEPLIRMLSTLMHLFQDLKSAIKVPLRWDLETAVPALWVSSKCVIKGVKSMGAILMCPVWKKKPYSAVLRLLLFEQPGLQSWGSSGVRLKKVLRQSFTSKNK